LDFAEPERKTDLGRKSSSVQILREATAIEKRMKLMKQNLLYNLDHCAFRLPYHVRVACFEWLGAADLARASAVCNSWKLNANSEDRLWRARYLAAFDEETGSAAQIADRGETTGWKRRFMRRKRVERNW